MKLFTQFAAVATSLTLSSLATSTVPQLPAMAVETEEKATVVEAEPVVETETRWVLPTANHAETKVLNALQDRGIEDRNALATVMGNIKQESKFNSNICEGGARVSYHGCRSGGYGLIQWTSIGRYRGLGSHAYRIGMDPSTVDAQISFLFTERQWRGIEPSLKTNGQSIGFYMGKTYYWLGWGIHGNRTTYAYQYASRLTSIEVPVT
ncbi:hypothetical protein S420910_213 [Synechococcus phage S-CAM7]|uniref:Phage tail lysozyme domain-containing protein n=1 Tax=Synechococcus phage S-CAM7 TaxID=1883368 RepID=A0A1D8KUP8_9CAUD|nr:hypothetical protein S420910_213 [Synechococcus phage S-CAM7]